MTYIDWTMNYQATREIRTFDVDAFISDVYNKFVGTPNEESREDLQTIWNKVLAMPRGGDASLYPNAHGPHPALLEVWHKAGDFWRANGFRKPARLLCDQNGIVIDEETAQKIAAAKAAINATETPQDAQADASEAIIQPASDTPTEATETPTATAANPFSVCDGSTVAPQATASDLASEPASDTEDAAAILSDTDDDNPGVIVPEAACPSPTPRRRRTRRTRTAAASLPSLFDGCEITESTDAPTETPADNETATASGIVTALKSIANNKTAREITKGICILATVAIIYECGLIIPFALLGGLASGLIK